MDSILITRYINFILVIIAIGAWIYLYIKYRKPAAIAALSWLFNSLAFYIYRLSTLSFSSTIKNTEFLNLWSSLIHTHAILLLMVAALIYCGTFKKIKRDKELANKEYMMSILEKEEVELKK
jgi:hypothetical protein